MIRRPVHAPARGFVEKQPIDETLAEMIGKVGPEQACDWMIEAALAAGAPDNVTVILARAEGDAPFAPAYGGPKHQLDGSPARFSWDFGI